MAFFAVITAKGPNWDHARDIREQAHWAEHGAFADGLVAKGIVILGGPVEVPDPDVIALIAVEADDADAARAVFAVDPWTEHGMFRVREVWPWTVWLDGRARVGSGARAD
jgi:uncharacterized protein YciI